MLLFLEVSLVISSRIIPHLTLNETFALKFSVLLEVNVLLVKSVMVCDTTAPLKPFVGCKLYADH